MAGAGSSIVGDEAATDISVSDMAELPALAVWLMAPLAVFSVLAPRRLPLSVRLMVLLVCSMVVEELLATLV